MRKDLSQLNPKDYNAKVKKTIHEQLEKDIAKLNTLEHKEFETRKALLENLRDNFCSYIDTCTHKFNHKGVHAKLLAAMILCVQKHGKLQTEKLAETIKKDKEAKYSSVKKPDILALFALQNDTVFIQTFIHPICNFFAKNKRITDRLKGQFQKKPLSPVRSEPDPIRDLAGVLTGTTDFDALDAKEERPAESVISDASDTSLEQDAPSAVDEFEPVKPTAQSHSGLASFTLGVGLTTIAFAVVAKVAKASLLALLLSQWHVLIGIGAGVSVLSLGVFIANARRNAEEAEFQRVLPFATA